jgi:hypothetical protein
MTRHFPSTILFLWEKHTLSLPAWTNPWNRFAAIFFWPGIDISVVRYIAIMTIAKPTTDRERPNTHPARRPLLIINLHHLQSRITYQAGTYRLAVFGLLPP